MPSPRTMGMGLTLACADQENMVWRLVSAMISSAVIVAIASVVVMAASYPFRGPTCKGRSSHQGPLVDPVEPARRQQVLSLVEPADRGHPVAGHRSVELESDRIGP